MVIKYKTAFDHVHAKILFHIFLTATDVLLNNLSASQSHIHVSRNHPWHYTIFNTCKIWKSSLFGNFWDISYVLKFCLQGKTKQWRQLKDSRCPHSIVALIRCTVISNCRFHSINIFLQGICPRIPHLFRSKMKLPYLSWINSSYSQSKTILGLK